MIDDSTKVIFIHIPKCGGNSIFRFQDPNKPEEVISYYKTFGHNIRNPDFKYYKDSDERKCSRFSFSFVRNPWDRLVSSYFYLKAGGSHGLLGGTKSLKCLKQQSSDGDAKDSEKYLGGYSSFEDMLLNWNDELFNQIHFKPQYKWLCDNNGDIIVDYVGKLENFQEDFDIICDRIGLPKLQVPHKNKSKHKHYTEYYDNETRQIVAEKYAKDIEYFGYKFGE